MSSSLRRPLVACLCALILGGFLAAQTGCNGCRDDAAAEKKKAEEEANKKKKKKQEKPKPDFEFRDTRTQPEEVTSGTARNAVKPGHWITVGSAVAANNFDFQADLHSGAVTGESVPIDIDHTNYHLVSSRPASLPKAKPMFFETLYYLPRRFLAEDALDTSKSTLTNLRSHLTAAGGTRMILERNDPPTMMEDQQFFIVVLAANPTSYAYLRALPTVSFNVPAIEDLNSTVMYYRVANPRVGNIVPMPSTALTWTSTAAIVIDDLDPTKFAVDQQTALVDWLHWGGQVLISGPNSLDRLKGSFLAPYLPAEASETRELKSDDLEPLNYWSLKPNRSDSKSSAAANWALQSPEGRALLGVKLQLTEGGEFVPHCGELVAEKRVGGGRVVVTSFPLTDTRVVSQWWNFDNFFNGALLRRPAREYKSQGQDQFSFGWGGQFKTMTRDPRLVSTLRYFSRDVGRYIRSEGEDKEAKSALTEEVSAETPPADVPPSRFQSTQQRAQRTYRSEPATEDWHFGGYWSERESGVAGWNDFSGAADAAKQTLKDAAKVKIPGKDFVLRMVAVYLILLVPVNWLLFRLLGRVEWAWVAAPVIAIAAAGMVIRLAQLDIGFVRSRTDISIVELQGPYDRAHVTRYTALYTSLSTSYDLAFEDPNALALPLAEDPAYRRRPTDTAVQVSFHRDQGATLRGFQVDSSTTAWTHSEQMLSCGGGLELTGDENIGWSLRNGTPWTLKDVGVIRGDANGKYTAAFVAALKPQTQVALTFDAATDDVSVAGWSKSSVMGSPQSNAQEAHDDGEVRLWRIVDLAAKQLQLRKGEVRLIAWTDEALPGLTIRPSSAQFTSRSLVVAHLLRAKFPAPERDLSTRADVDSNFGSPLTDKDINGGEKPEPPAETEPEKTTPSPDASADPNSPPPSAPETAAPQP